LQYLCGQLPVRSETIDKRSRNGAVSLRPEAMRPDSLRVGIFSESFAPVRNGVATSLDILVKGLRSCGHRVWVCAPANDSAASHHETNVLRFPSFVTAYNREYPLAYPFYPGLALSTHFNRLRLDIVHTHAPFVLGLTGARLAITRGTPLISTYHTLYSNYTHYLPVLPESMSQSLLDVYLPWYYNRCSHVICPSAVSQRSLKSIGVESPISVLPTGVPLPPAVPMQDTMALRDENGWTNKRVLLYAGRLAEEKNVPHLLQAFRYVIQQNDAVHLVIIGDGPERGALEAMAAQMLPSGTISFLGAISREKMNHYYAAADIFCFASVSETQGLVAGEARAAGLPAVLVNQGGAPETFVHGEDALLAPPGDPDAFAAHILAILENHDLWSSMKQHALRRAQMFTPEKMISQVTQLYEEVRNQPPPLRSLVPPLENTGKGSYWNIFSQHWPNG
jgi:1,2-diacylglycerol 3-alpha-glucosyltransferase